MDTISVLNKYIGIPYEFAGFSHDSADCIGLVRLFYKEHNWEPEIYDGEFEEDWYIKTPFRMIRFFIKNMNKIKKSKELQFGDIVLFMINGESHCGIYLEYGKLLTTFPHSKQWNTSEMPESSFISHRDFWEKGFKIGFRRR